MYPFQQTLHQLHANAVWLHLFYYPARPICSPNYPQEEEEENFIRFNTHSSLSVVDKNRRLIVIQRNNKDALYRA